MSNVREDGGNIDRDPELTDGPNGPIQPSEPELAPREDQTHAFRESTIRAKVREDYLTRLDFLSDRDKAVLCKLYGLDDGRSRTREDVATEFGITPFRVSMIVSMVMYRTRAVWSLTPRSRSRDEPAAGKQATGSKRGDSLDRQEDNNTIVQKLDKSGRSETPNRAPALDDLLATRTHRERLNDELSILSQLEREILLLRYGLDDDRPHTLQDVGDQLGLTRDETQAIEFAALRKLNRRGRDDPETDAQRIPRRPIR